MSAELPPCPTTGIGSLPHADVAQALECSFAAEVPWWPQLLGVDPREGLLAQALEGVPGATPSADGAWAIDLGRWRDGRDAFIRRLDDGAGFEPSPEVARAWRPFLERLERGRPRLAKVQLAGPATVRWFTRTVDGRPLGAQLDEQLGRLVEARALSLVGAVRQRGVTPVVFLDEPGLVLLSPANPVHALVLEEVRRLIARLQGAGALVGLHCCGNTAWAQVLDLGLDVLSFDARCSLDALTEPTAAWRRFVASGAALCLGVIPTDGAAAWALGELCESVEASLRATAPPGTTYEALLARAWLSPACGLGLKSGAEAERIEGRLREAQRLLRATL